MRSQPIVGAGVVVCVAMALTACSTAVSVDAPDTDDKVTDICLGLSRQLPETLNSQSKRPVEPLNIRTAAWGDPPIVYRCGVGRPAALTPTSFVTSVNGVDWFPEEHTEGFVFTTINREANIEVTVPKAYTPEATVLTDFSDLIKQQDPTVKTMTN